MVLITERQQVSVAARADALDCLPAVGIDAGRLVHDDEQIRASK
jgi:hypothetical protein